MKKRIFTPFTELSRLDNHRWRMLQSEPIFTSSKEGEVFVLFEIFQLA